jgi:hypothetical protein
MKCVLCGATSIDAKIEQFPLSPEAREMLKRQLAINSDEAFTEIGVCRECSALAPAEQKKLADKAIEDELDEHRRDLIKETLYKNRNGN